MKTVMKTFLKGLTVILPIGVTAYIVYWLAVSAESLLGGVARALLPEGWYVPGTGIVVGLAFIFGVGILTGLWAFRRLFEWAELLVEKTPLVKSLYGGVKDLMGFFASSQKDAANRVVMVTVAENVRLLGFVTREDFGDLPEGFGTEGEVSVYLPMSYQIGGFTVVVPRAAVKPIDMSAEDAMRLAMTAGMSTEKQATRLTKGPATEPDGAPQPPRAEGH